MADGGMMDNVMKMAPMAMMALAPGGEVSGNPLLSAPSQAAPAPNWAGQYKSPASEGGGPSIEATPQAAAGQTTDLSDTAKDAQDNYQTAKAGKQVKGGNKQASDITGSFQSPEMGSQFASAAPSLMGALAHGGKVYHPQYFHEYFAGGGMSGRAVDAIVSPKEVYLNPRQVKEVIERGADPIKIGHHFPGQDKVKKKDSYSNDVIKTKLEDGGVVLPLHVTTHKDASNKGRKFVERAIAKHMKRPGGAQ
jgi:hypothetical protein